MKLGSGADQCANYPESAAWMVRSLLLSSRTVTQISVAIKMLHAWDHFDYTHDLAWFKAQGWPLLKVNTDI